MTGRVVLFSESVKLVREIRHHFAGTSFAVEVTASRDLPERADYVVTRGSPTRRPVEILAAHHHAIPAAIPESLLYLTAQAHARGGLVLIGSDRK
ncbi:hypothetical protein [Prescottella equi]